jgi:hypothetical protein
MIIGKISLDKWQMVQFMARKPRPLYGQGRFITSSGPSPLGNKTGVTKVDTFEPGTGKHSIMTMHVSQEAREAARRARQLARAAQFKGQPKGQKSAPKKHV